MNRKNKINTYDFCNINNKWQCALKNINEKEMIRLHKNIYYKKYKIAYYSSEIVDNTPS